MTTQKESQATDNYIETNFRYLSIGSPVPLPVQDCPESGEDDPGKQDGIKSGKDKTYFFGSESHGKICPKGHDKDKPSIMVEQCQTPKEPDMCTECNHDNSSRNSDMVSLHSPSQESLLLSPTPPLGRRSVNNSKTITYYGPALTCSKSEGSIHDVMNNQQHSAETHSKDSKTETISCSLTSSRSSSSSSPILVYDTHSRLSPTRSPLHEAYERRNQSASTDRMDLKSMSGSTPLTLPPLSSHPSNIHTKQVL